MRTIIRKRGKNLADVDHVKVLGTKPNDLTLITRMYMVERRASGKLSSELDTYMHHSTYMPPTYNE